MNIVIADDEEIILKWMKKNIEALSPENRVIDMFVNGKQVLNCCLNHQVDVLFTDIRMPVMDGMELLKKLNQNSVLPYTIVLSAYDDFSYARDCIKLGVSEFLLKSEITKDEIEQCLRRAGERLENNESAENRENSPGEEMEKVLQQYFKEPDYVSKDLLEQTWNRCCEINGNYTVIVFHDTNRISNPEQLKEIIPFSFQDDKRTIYSIPKREKEIIVLTEIKNDNPQKIAEKIYHAVSSFGGLNMYVSSSGVGKTAEELEVLYRHSREVSDYQLFYNHVGGLDYEAMKNRTVKVEPVLEEKFKTLETLINNQTWNKMTDEIEGIFKFVKDSKPGVSYLRKLFLNMLLNMYWSYLDEADRRAFSVDKIIEITNCSHISQLESQVSLQAEEIKKVLIGKQKNYSDSVLKIMQYIEDRYAESVTLEELAKYVHMNRSYISHLFKKETDSNINTYLLEFRMEKAKVLLKSSKNSIQDICCQIGIPDSAYFSKVFKKYVGITPLEFRRISNEN